MSATTKAIFLSYASQDAEAARRICDAQRDGGLAWTKVDPFLRSLHADPRWNPLLRKMGLAD